MHNLNDAFAQLKLNCQGSTSLMLVKALNANSLSLSALSIFDEIADYPADMIIDPDARAKLVAELLAKSLTFVASQGTSGQ